MKKRGFGAGKWNGFGGKVNFGESIIEATKREINEEANIIVQDLEQCGKLHFVFLKNPNEELEVHVYRADKFVGEPKESEEMRPQWFLHDAIPYKEMWPDDQYWLPIFLDNKKFEGWFWFEEGDVISKSKLEIID